VFRKYETEELSGQDLKGKDEANQPLRRREKEEKEESKLKTLGGTRLKRGVQKSS